MTLATRHLVASKWIASPKFPISSHLAQLRPSGAAKDSSLRPNVVSEKLCEDSLRRLAPTLESYRGCDVVDINPGSCIWSSKLHEFLRPRRHLLVEPDGRTYQKYLAPLVSAAPSVYRHVPIDTDNFENLENIILDHHLPEQEEQDPISQSSANINRTLLVTGNLSPNAVDGNDLNRFVNISLHRNHAFNRSYFQRSLFNKYGLVRMLFWIPYHIAGRILPKGAADRSKDSALVEIASHVTMVACPQTSIDSESRRYPLHLQSRQDVASLMLRNSAYDPEDRRSQPRRPDYLDLGYEDEKLATAIRHMKNVPEWVQEFVALRSTMPSTETNPTMRRRSHHQGPDKAKVERFRALDIKLKKLVTSRRKVDRLLGQYLEAPDTRPLEDQMPGEPLAESGKMSDSVSKDRVAKVDEEVARLPDLLNRAFMIGVDDLLLYNRSPPGLSWDRRRTEPLINFPDEFYPQEPLCLMDFQPIAANLARIDSNERYAYLLHFLTQAFRSPTRPLHEVLEDIAPDGLEYFIEQVPALSEYYQGSPIMLRQFRVRAVPSHVFLDIALAWCDWPFRPPLREIIVDLPLGDRATMS